MLAYFGMAWKDLGGTWSMESLYGGMHVSVPRVSKCASIPSGSKVECKCNGMDMEQPGPGLISIPPFIAANRNF